MGPKSCRDASGNGTVDTLGLLLKVVVHPANLQDREGARLVLGSLKAVYPRMEKLWADQAYTGPLKDWIKATLGWTLELIKHPPPVRGSGPFPIR